MSPRDTQGGSGGNHRHHRHGNFNSNGGSIRVLNVAEKPSVARALAQVFNGIEGSHDGGMHRSAAQVFTHQNVRFPSIFSQGHGIPKPQNTPAVPHEMITTSVRGHLASTDFPTNYGWSSCAPVQLFEAPIETFYRDDMQPLEQMLSQQARQVVAVILWLDCDREGEAIADEVREVCLRNNGRLQIYRAKFSTVLPAEIKRALYSLGRVNESFVDAVKARSELDLRVGAAFTRFQTLRLQKKFDIQGVISYGPCQFPTLGFVVERWARIETFVPEDYWYLELKLKVPNHPVDENGGGLPQQAQRELFFKWKRDRLYDRAMTLALYESSLDVGEAVVTNLNGRPKNRWRPVPLATVEMQKRASRFLRMGAEQVMSVAEELYQQGLISYPRTETEKFRPEFQHRPLIQQFANLGAGEFGNYADKLLNDDFFQRPRNGQHDDQAHPPITPCKAVDPNTIDNGTHRQLYCLIVKHYLACVSRDATGRETTMTVWMGTEEFTATGLMILEKNWLEIYAPYERWSTGQGELPNVQIGSRIRPSSFMMKDGRTVPPQLISEVELISLMDTNGIGTDATIAQHIQTIQTREYARKNGNQRFEPTKLGIALVEGYNSMGYQLNKPDLRRETEHECNMVATGQKTKDDIMGPLLAKMKQCFQRANTEATKLDDAVARHFPRVGTNPADYQMMQQNFSECGVCNRPMALKASRSNNNNEQRSHQRKLLFCSTCHTGHLLPRGSLQPHTVNDNPNSGPTKCPICNFQVLKIGPGDGYTGKGYKFCPKCYSDPPAEHGGGGQGHFRCFQCQHPTCSLASGTPGGEIEVFRCPWCQNGSNGRVMLRKNSRGFILSCNQYSGPSRCQYTIWLPKEAISVSVPTPTVPCPQCSTVGAAVEQIRLAWKPGSVPPHLGTECTVCVLCDSDFRRELNVRLPQMNQVGTNTRRTRNFNASASGRGTNRGGLPPGGRTASGRSQGGGRGGSSGGNVCFRCGQPGHFANACPNQ